MHVVKNPPKFIPADKERNEILDIMTIKRYGYN